MKTVLEQALEALMVSKYCIEKERYSTDCSYGSNFIQSRVDRIEQTEKLHKEAIAALKEVIKQQGEPVAWRWSESNGARWFDWRTDWGYHEAAKKHGCLIEYAYTSAPTIPEGWQLVPKEPTQKMLETAYLRIESEGVHTTPWMRGTIYKAMLSAAPKGDKP